MLDQNYVYLMHYKLEWFDDEYKEWLDFEDNDSRISVHKTLQQMMQTAVAVFHEYDGDYFGRPDCTKAESTEKYLVRKFEAAIENTLKIKAELERRVQVDRIRLYSGKFTRSMPVDAEIAEMWSKHGTLCYLRTYPESGRRIVFNFSRFDFIDLESIPGFFPKMDNKR